MAIQSFRSSEIEKFYLTGKVPSKCGWQNLSKIALRKLDMLNYAIELKDLKSPPQNHLKALKGDLINLFSIRINDKWRIVFEWTPKGPTNVDIVDYH